MFLIYKERTIDTFPARDLKLPPGNYERDNISEYSIRGGYGLELSRRRSKRKKPFIV